MGLKVANAVIDQLTWLDQPGEALAGLTRQAVDAGGPAAMAVKDALHGTWLGHPLHPALVAIPLGAWTSTLALDLAGQERAADLSLMLGIGGAVAAALAGIVDWSETQGRQRRTGSLHALLNTTGLSLNVASLVLRLRGRRPTAVALSSVAYLLGNAAAYFGGELSYSQGVGVNHEAFDEAPTEFVPVIEATRLVDGEPLRAMAGSTPVFILKRGTQICALHATCTHAGGPLDEGAIDGDTVTCPWHGSIFNVCSGSVLRGPASEPAMAFDVHIVDGMVQVRRHQ